MVWVVLQIVSAQLLNKYQKLQYWAVQLPEEAAILVPSESCLTQLLWVGALQNAWSTY